MRPRHMAVGAVAMAIAIATGGITGTALADPPAATDPTPMTVTSQAGPIEATALNARGEGATFRVPAGGWVDIPTEEGGYTRLVISEGGRYIGEYPLYNPGLRTFCDVGPASPEPRLNCGIIA
ncbi:hypothetical protein [Pseudonocardia parietis]|uniref:Secreted protein n=1 Tax=Pseudonocardia parietis TaxID=570936 RepID=A0ABS4VTY1_9PSEU|nr:hypothetical protein [Pseudonocardia parietis]MBP2367387.1 hypothetical protein [Pseudonocardia parietis]